MTWTHKALMKWTRKWVTILVCDLLGSLEEKLRKPTSKKPSVSYIAMIRKKMAGIWRGKSP